MRVAFVHDWLFGMRGGERCLEVLCNLYPNSEIFTLFYQEKGVTDVLNDRPVFTSSLAKLPGVKKYYRGLLPLFPFAAVGLAKKLAARHQEKPFDMVISVSHCAAKNLKVPAGVPHLCYCLTPVRYLWDQYDSYFKNRWYEPLVRICAVPLRRWDVRGAKGVTRYVAISRYVAARIERYYGRESDIVFPPVRTEWIMPRKKGDITGGFLCVCALVPYKNVDIIVQAFNRMRRPLTIVGTGPEAKKLKALAGSTITFIEKLTDAELARKYRSAEALVFAAEEDFGMVPVEAQAAGCPVIFLGRGGALETVVGDTAQSPSSTLSANTMQPPTGIVFFEPTVESLIAAVTRFDDKKSVLAVESCVAQADKFSEQHFVESFSAVVNHLLARQTVRNIGPIGARANGRGDDGL